MQGNLQVLYIKIGQDFEPIGCLTSNSFDLSVENFDTTTRVDGLWANSVPDVASYQIGFEGILDLNRRSGQTIEILARNRSIVEWAIGNNSNFYRNGKGYIANYSDSAPVNNKVTFSATIIGKGDYDLTLPIGSALQADLDQGLQAEINQGLNTD